MHCGIGETVNRLDRHPEMHATLVSASVREVACFIIRFVRPLALANNGAGRKRLRLRSHP